MAPHSSTLVLKIPWMEEPGRLQSMGSLRVGHNWTTSLSLFTFMHWRRKWQPTPVFLPGESQGRGSLVGCHLWHRVGHNWSNLAAAEVFGGFLGGSDSKESAFQARNMGTIYGLRRSPGEGNGYPLQYSCLGNLMDRGALWATVHGVSRVRHNFVTKPQQRGIWGWNQVMYTEVSAQCLTHCTKLIMSSFSAPHFVPFDVTQPSPVLL